MTNIKKFEIFNLTFEEFKKHDKRKFPCIITDPPYGVDFKNDIYDDSLIENNILKWMHLLRLSLKEDGHIYIFVPSKEIDIWTKHFKKHFELKNILSTKIYNTNKVFKNRFNDSLQLILFGNQKGTSKELNEIDWIERSKSWLNDKRNKNSYQRYTYNYPSFINEFSNVKANAYKKLYHPNQKNEDFISTLIKLSTKENEYIFDPFGGSFSTCCAAISSNRKCVSLEPNFEMFNIGKKRLEELLRKVK